MEKVEIGNCILYHGDCFDVMKDLQSSSIDSVITDPPYLYLKHKLDRHFNYELVFNETDRLLKNDRLICLFGRGFGMYKWGVYFESLGYNFKESLIWNKNATTSIFGSIMRCHEDIMLLSKGTCKLNKIKNDYFKERLNNDDLYKIKNDINRILKHSKSSSSLSNALEKIKNGIKLEKFVKHGIACRASRGKDNINYTSFISVMDGLCQTSIITVKREHRSMEHPTQKPIDLMKRLIKICTQENDIILDAFMGSGSTGVACINTNRKFIGIEIDKEYFNIACKRIREAVENKQHELELI